MPPYTDKVVSDQDLADIHAFLKALRPPAAAATIPLLK
jgi:cytochrome c553